MIDVYIAVLPIEESCTPLCCVERQAEIDGISNERVRREKYYVWRLLEYAVKNSLGADASRFCFTKGKNGRWLCEGFEFSLSHSGDALAVAISDKAVGVDIERIRVKSSDRMAKYILTQNEFKEYDLIELENREEWLIQKWCEKEAIFKSQNKESFIPSEIETANFYSCLKTLLLQNEKYILAAAAKCCSEVRILDGIKFFQV